ncbi:DUF4293 domain-containing protein [Sphingobacterium gobiense]|uniref:DUF4293 domain-containing protein n=1 Tax=Sphingobacterium gobiense TaxID=1382456 RepID=A0A2S9JLB0_9SPHI|nr:DUF4293 domain-containing protein [Sphingobacterium gobiense]PRD53898.1 DUF4293 domain-containing protein [Sphingobacterium gobiense]
MTSFLLLFYGKKEDKTIFVKQEESLVMIQRIQTLWLLAAAIILLGLFVFPFVSYIDLVGLGKQIYVTGIYSSNNNESVRESTSIALAIYAGIVTIVPLLIVFQYKNRKRQVLFIMVEIALIVLLGIWMWSTAHTTLDVINQKVRAGNIGVGFFLLPIAIIFLGMAIGAIRKDEKLIKSADRLR